MGKFDLSERDMADQSLPDHCTPMNCKQHLWQDMQAKIPHYPAKTEAGPIMVFLWQIPELIALP